MAESLLRPAVAAPRVFLCIEPVDFRKSIDGLSLIVEQGLSLDPFGSVLYVFVNKRRDKIKILLWEKNGFILVRPEVALLSVKHYREVMI